MTVQVRFAREVQVAGKTKIVSEESPFVEWLTASIVLLSCMAFALAQLLAK
jgi:hypothetical protein